MEPVMVIIDRNGSVTVLRLGRAEVEPSKSKDKESGIAVGGLVTEEPLTMTAAMTRRKTSTTELLRMIEWKLAPTKVPT